MATVCAGVPLLAADVPANVALLRLVFGAWPAVLPGRDGLRPRLAGGQERYRRARRRAVRGVRRPGGALRAGDEHRPRQLPLPRLRRHALEPALPRAPRAAAPPPGDLPAPHA